MSNKLLKSELKEIVKECLVEILSEGIGLDTNNQRTRKNLNESKSKKAGFDHAEWSRDFNNPETTSGPSAEDSARALTDDPILAEVLADSQRTMLNQMSAERAGISSMAGDHAAREAASSDPLSLFGESAGNWASLAFSDK